MRILLTMLFELQEIIAKLEDMPDSYLFAIEHDLKGYFDKRRKQQETKENEDYIRRFYKAKQIAKDIAREYKIPLATMLGVEKVYERNHGFVRNVINPNNPSEKWNDKGVPPIWYLKLKRQGYDMDTLPYEVVRTRSKSKAD